MAAQVARGAAPIVCPGHTRPLAEVSFSEMTPDGRFLISACLDGRIGMPMLRDASTGDWIGTFAGHKGAVWSAKLCSEARLAATGSGDFTAKVWDAVTGGCVATLEHKHIVKSVDFSADRTRLATAGHEGVVRIFDVERAAEPAAATGLVVEALWTSPKIPKPLNKVLWTTSTLTGDPSSTKLLVAGGADGVVRVFDPRSNPGSFSACLVAAVDTPLNAEVRDLEISQGALGPTLTVAAGDNVAFLDADTWMPRRDPIACPVHFREEGGASLRQAPGGGGRLVLGGGRHGGSRQGALGVEKGATNVGDIGSDLTVFGMDYATGAIVEERKGHCGPVRCARFHPDGKAFVTGSEDATIRLWESPIDDK